MRPLLGNGAGLAASFVFVFAAVAGPIWLQRRRLFGPEAARKVTHIVAAHWWLIAMAVFDDLWAASVGPACALLAAASIPIREDGRRDRGIISYAAALLALVILSWRGIVPRWIAGIGVLVMGWGDGAAGLVGARFGRGGVRIWGRKKTIQGTAAMFLASFALALALTGIFDPRAPGLPGAVVISLWTAAAATALELLTPLGIDNLTISLGTTFFYAWISR